MDTVVLVKRIGKPSFYKYECELNKYKLWNVLVSIHFINMSVKSMDTVVLVKRIGKYSFYKYECDVNGYNCIVKRIGKNSL